ncbi:elongation factor tu GTP binding domain-containing protein [Ditylenchus destructor]|uniref:Translation initiation factor IF-2, mitochondrial n=1 Tax=Ditylenchus destructor TaxID=166010 RepID=A0AAD4MWD5_9BILA|nr:elongation factor tu GTP binding domain-containing protein [Ditylenchus destructor]
MNPIRCMQIARCLFRPSLRRPCLNLNREFCLTSASLLQFSLPDNILHNRRRKGKFAKPEGFKAGMQESKRDTLELYSDASFNEIMRALDSDYDTVAEALLKLGEKYLHILDKPDMPISDRGIISNVIAQFGVKLRFVDRPVAKEEKDDSVQDAVPLPPAPEKECLPRPPVVTIMGHVDHGKTTLLDALRNSRIVSQEFGGITQHIGAFKVTLPKTKDKVTFIDTPGHAAFKSMRERGAQSTDIVVLVVAADDGPKDQTVESIRYANEAGVPIIVAINKCDKPMANPQNAINELLQYDLIPESMGGNTKVVEISALRGTNLDQLQEVIIRQAKEMDLKATPKGKVEGVVIESTIAQGTGNACSMIVTRGTLRKGAFLVAGMAEGKVRAMKDDLNQNVSEAGPSTPVRVFGWRENLPPPGEVVLEVENEERSKEVIHLRKERELEKKAEETWEALQPERELHQEKHNEARKKLIQQGDTHPKLSVILRGDVDGSVEAIVNVLETYEGEEVEFRLLDFDVGSPNELNIEIAKKLNATIVCFNVSVPAQIRQMAAENKIEILEFNVIYHLVDRIKQILSSKLPEKEDVKVLGSGDVIKEFRMSDGGKKKQPIAGISVKTGKFDKSAIYRFIRTSDKGESFTYYEGPIVSMKNQHGHIENANPGTEVGVMLGNKDVRFKEGDEVEVLERIPLKRTIDWYPPGF